MGRWHADAARRAGGQVVAVVDQDAGRAASLAARHPGARAETVREAALESARASVVHLCTPLGTHQALAETALDRGAHILIEKPFAEDAPSTAALLERARSRGVHAIPTHQFLFQRGVLEALDGVRDIGPLVHVELTAFSAGAGDRQGAERDRIAAEILPHPLSLLARLPLTGPASLAWHAEHPAPGELLATASAGGVAVSLLISLRARPTRNHLRLAGENGTIHVDLFHGFAVREAGGVSRARKIAQPFAAAGGTLLNAALNLTGRAARREVAYPGLRELVARFYGALEAGAPPPISPEETLEVAAARDVLIRLLRGLSGSP
jgi:predicted dehydrogenase